MASLATPITIKGRYFWKGDERFLIKGVVYQQHNHNNEGSSSPESDLDPLADDQLEDLRLSIPLFKELGLNTLFVYTIDETKNHDAAMDLLADAGIYVLASLSTSSQHIRRNSPRDSYTQDLVRHYFRAAYVMSRYANTLGLIIANEVINTPETTRAAPMIRALVRDVRRYLTHISATDEASDDDYGWRKRPRVLPLGYSAAAVQSVLMPQYKYFSADGGGDGGAVDFFSFNCYSWCGRSSMEMSGYSKHVSNFSSTPIPIFISEYGCTLNGPRIFQEAAALYSPAMTPVFSGGIVYEFLRARDDHGLVRRRTQDTDDDDDDEGNPRVCLERTPDFASLRASLHHVALRPPVTLSAHPLARPAMPRSGTAFWRADQAALLPGCPLDWEEEVRVQAEDGQWVDVGREMEKIKVEDLAEAIWERLRFGDAGLSR
ncbi:glycolipid anchored surface protein [Camillea tinctor]|nr:glycolipid anchored surface protein [Camillea tinctor]